MKRPFISIHSSAKVYSNKGHTLSFLGHHEEALVAYDDAISRNSRLAVAHFNRGIALGGDPEAVEAFEEAIRFKYRASSAFQILLTYGKCSLSPLTTMRKSGRCL